LAQKLLYRLYPHPIRHLHFAIAAAVGNRAAQIQAEGRLRGRQQAFAKAAGIRIAEKQKKKRS